MNYRPNFSRRDALSLLGLTAAALVARPASAVAAKAQEDTPLLYRFRITQPNLSAGLASAELKKYVLEFAQKRFPVLKDRFMRIDDGTEFTPGFRAMLPPGHTPGHSIVDIQSGSERLLHIVDLAHLRWCRCKDLLGNQFLMAIPNRPRRLVRGSLLKSPRTVHGSLATMFRFQVSGIFAFPAPVTSGYRNRGRRLEARS
jgi:glyoxylase-like metal-dependent hydrolase (beta-lactamase superfamily II)